jgi:hypothetical protein
VISRAAIVVLLAAGVLLSGALPAPGGPPPPAVARTIYVVQPDPRLCPSPLCGGYWVSRANHARTRCHDGLLRPRCYVAIAIGASSRKPLATGVPANSLVRGIIGTWPFDGFGDLGAVIVTDLWGPVSQAPPTGDFFRLRDIGVRCIRAPCFSLRAWRVNRPFSITASDLDFGEAHATPGQLRRAEAALSTPEGVFAAGRISGTATGGRVFRATQLFLRAPQPRA